MTTPDGPRPTGLENMGPLGFSGPLGNGVATVFVEASPLDSGARLEVLVPEARVEGDTEPEAVDDPSLVLAGPLPAGERREAPEEARELAWDGSTYVARFRFPPGTSFYGTGARAGRLERTGLHALCWNTDAFGFGEHSAALYQSQPAVLAVGPGGAATYVVALSARKIRVSIGTDGVELAVEGAPCAIARLTAADPATALAGLTELIGRPAPVPRWALGYHQCRWSYMTQEEARGIVDGFDAHDLPLSALWLDIDYMDRFRVFTWNRETFPDLPGLVGELEGRGVKTVAIIDPGLSVSSDYDVGQEARAGDHLVLDPRGRPVEGRVWPGRCHFPDFTREQTREWWAEKVRAFVEGTGLAGIWCDMNEPAVFATPTLTLREDAVHRGFGGGTHARFHNLYGQLMVEATRAGLEAARPARAPFVLTRAAHLATPRTAATWTGDNLSRWDDLRWSISMILGLGLVGQPTVGPDVGGFVGDPGPELFARWFEVGCYYPFFRGHAEMNSARKEPWSFGQDALSRVKAALRWRARLLPYLEACFAAARETGVPVMRPLFFAAPEDPRLRDVDDAFLLGDDLLVVPALEPGTPAREIPLPPGRWRRVPVGALLEAERPSGSREIEVEGPDEEHELHLEIPPGPAPCFLRVGGRVPLAPVELRPCAEPTWPVLETLVAG